MINQDSCSQVIGLQPGQNATSRSFRPAENLGDTLLHCPICGMRAAEFIAWGHPSPRPNAACPGCQSLERHRLLWLFLAQKTNFFRAKLRVLHFAPEACFHDRFKKLPNLDYISADLKSPKAMMRMDITQIPLPEASVDCFICCHVLEHVPDDTKALSELHRILSPKGWGIIMIPINNTLPATLEDPTADTPQRRQTLYGYKDHIRLYGNDFTSRLNHAGFRYFHIEYASVLGPDYARRCCLLPDDIYFCIK